MGEYIFIICYICNWCSCYHNENANNFLLGWLSLLLASLLVVLPFSFKITISCFLVHCLDLPWFEKVIVVKIGFVKSSSIYCSSFVIFLGD